LSTCQKFSDHYVILRESFNKEGFLCFIQNDSFELLDIHFG
jgi:hypothetical protein